MDEREFRTMALSLPEAVEQPHFDSASFRIRGRIFATIPASGDRAHVFVSAPDVHEAILERPSWCHELWWGRKLSGVRIDLRDAEPGIVRELIVEAWRVRAPRRLVAAFEQTLSDPTLYDPILSEPTLYDLTPSDPILSEPTMSDPSPEGQSTDDMPPST